MTSVMDTPQGQQLLDQIQLGLDGESFLASRLGGYIIDRLIELQDEAYQQLMDADPFIPVQIVQAQNNVRIPAMVLQLINDCVQEGKQAERELLGPQE